MAEQIMILIRHSHVTWCRQLRRLLLKASSMVIKPLLLPLELLLLCLLTHTFSLVTCCATLSC